MIYQIKYSYNTGDSFGHEDNLEAILPYKWENLDRAKESLARIRDHYKWFCDLDDCRKPKTRDELMKEAATKPWFVEKYSFCLMLVDDKGEPFQCSSSWCGYFESLNWAEIITEPVDNGMRIEF